MNRLAVLVPLLFVLFILACLATAADPIAEQTARYTCPNGQNEPQLTIDLNAIKVKLANSNQTKNFDFMDKATFNQTTNSCKSFRMKDFNNTKQIFYLSWDNSHHRQQLQLEFIGNTSAYHLDRIVYQNIENQINIDYELVKPNLKFIGNELRTEKQGYKCGKINFKLTNKDSKEAAEVEFKDFMFFALQNNVETTKVTRLECRQEPGSSTIPMIVGGALLGVAAVVVIIYFVLRKKTPASDGKE